MLPSACGLEQHFQALSHSFSPYRPTSRQITYISSPFKPHTNAHTVCGRPLLNAHTVCGRPLLNVFERFMKGSLRRLYERSIYERTFLSEPIENYMLYQMSYPMLIMYRSICINIIAYCRRDREPSRIPIGTLERLRNKNRKAREFFYKTVTVI